MNTISILVITGISMTPIWILMLTLFYVMDKHKAKK
jgi:hypothetical protein